MSRSPLRRLAERPDVHEIAAAWALHLEDGDLSASDQARLARWLEADPLHCQAFEDANWALDSMASHAASFEFMTLRERALAARAGRPRRALSISGVAIGLAATLAGLLILVPEMRTALPGASVEEAAAPSAIVYSTNVGERKLVSLPDGSVATLDTNSALEVAYSGEERTVELKQGQALFEVAKGNLPFHVFASGQRITAVGTTFNVRIDGDELKVSLIEGVIKVSRRQEPRGAAAERARPAGELTLAPGEQLVAAYDRPLEIKAAAAAEVASWKSGLLVFNDTELSEAVTEVNRYTDRPVRIADPSLSSLRVSGVFKSSDPRRFAMAMTDLFPVEVDEAPDGAQVLRRRRSSQ